MLVFYGGTREFPSTVRTPEGDIYNILHKITIYILYMSRLYAINYNSDLKPHWLLIKSSLKLRISHHIKKGIFFV